MAGRATEQERYYECERCGTRAVVALRATSDEDATTALDLVRCPRCEELPPGAVTRSVAGWVMRVGGAFALAVGSFAALGPTVVAFTLAVAGVGAAIGLPRRWHAARRARLVRWRKPARPAPLPEVRVHALPSAPARPAVEAREPERIEPATDEPRILKR